MDIVQKDKKSNDLKQYIEKYNITQQEVSQSLNNLKNEISNYIPYSRLVRNIVKFDTQKDFDLAVIYYKKLSCEKPSNIEEAQAEIERMNGILPISKTIDWKKTIAFILKYIQENKFTKLEIRKTVDFFLEGLGGKFHPTSPEFNIKLQDVRYHIKIARRKLEHSFYVYGKEKKKQGFYNRFDEVL